MQRRKGSVDINATTQTCAKGAKSFQIKGDGVNFVASADNEAARDEWVKEIEAAIRAQKEEKAQKISREQAQKRSSEELVLLRILQVCE